MHYMRFPLENIDDVLVLHYGEERLLVSLALSSKEERYEEMLKFVGEEWGLEREAIIFETDEHPLCNGKRTKMDKSLFVPHITSLIGNIHVSVRKPVQPVEEITPEQTLVDEAVKVKDEEGTDEHLKTEKLQAAVEAVKEYMLCQRMFEKEMEKKEAEQTSSSEEATIMIDREETMSDSSWESEESAPYDPLADSAACMAETEKETETENEAEDNRSTATVESPLISEMELPIRKSDNRIFIRIYKGDLLSRAVVFKVKATQTLRHVFEGACVHFQLNPVSSYIYEADSDVNLDSRMQEHMGSICEDSLDFVIYSC